MNDQQGTGLRARMYVLHKWTQERMWSWRLLYTALELEARSSKPKLARPSWSNVEE